MAISSPVSRKPIHHRQVKCSGYLRDDNLWDLEASLVDTKGYAFETIERGTLKIGEPVHQMLLRVTLDDTLTIRGIEADIDAAPFQLCQKVPPRMERLKGIQIGKGWMKEVGAQLGGTEGCTHLIEMLKVIATTAYQTIHPYRIKDTEGPKIIHASIVDQCQGFASDGEVVVKHFPEYAKASKPE